MSTTLGRFAHLEEWEDDPLPEDTIPLDTRIREWTKLCTCRGCNRKIDPFTVEHFWAWSNELTLDSGRKFKPEPFQLAFVDDLFAFTRAEIPAECWLVVAEGNAKTTLTAALVLYYLEHYPTAAIPVAAPAKETADTLYLQADGFISRCDRLSEKHPNVARENKGFEGAKWVPRVECQEGFRRIKFFAGGRLQIRAADERTADGLIPAGIQVLDEPHRLLNLGLYRLWLGKGQKRKCPIVAISTAGEPGSEFEETRAELRRGDHVEVSDDGCFTRSIGPAYVIHDWALPADAQTDDLELLAVSNPLSTVTVETLEQKLSQKSFNLAHWRRLTCNIATRSEFAAITDAEWLKAESQETIPLDAEIWVGIDFGWKIDTTAIVPLYWKRDDYRLLGPAKVLVPPRDGSSLDEAFVKNSIIHLFQQNKIDTVVCDPSDARGLAEWMEDELRIRVIERQQSNSFAVDDYKYFMEALRNGWLKHTGDRDLRAHVLNANARVLPYGDLRFDRPVQSRRSLVQQDRRVIDALIAAAMVHTSAAIELSGASDEPLVSFG